MVPFDANEVLENGPKRVVQDSTLVFRQNELVEGLD
jgi:hypothetical protein